MESADRLYHESETYKDYASSFPNRFIVSCFTCLSTLGASLIIASYVIWKDIRTTSRKILVCISINDLLVSAGYLVGNLMSEEHRENGHAACIAQSFITSSASIMSFMWSTSLAIYLHLTLARDRQNLANKLIPIFHVISWATGPIINIIASAKGALGYSSDKVTAGWCWIAHHPDRPENRNEELLWMLFDGKFWEILAMGLILVLYISVKLKIRHELVREQQLRIESVRPIRHGVLKEARTADRKLIFIPMLFILCRIWGTVRFILFWAEPLPTYHPNIINKILLSLQAVGDSSQGIVNCTLFCFLTPKVFSHLVESFQQLRDMLRDSLSRYQRSKYLIVKNIESYSFIKSVESSTELKLSSSLSFTSYKGERSSLFHSSIEKEAYYGMHTESY